MHRPSCLEEAVGGLDARSELGVVLVMDLVGEVHLFFIGAGGSSYEARGMDRGQNILKQPLRLVIQRSPHAGIDLLQNYSASLRRGFPRTRGDRPALRFTIARLREVPPHTRG